MISCIRLLLIRVSFHVMTFRRVFLLWFYYDGRDAYRERGVCVSTRLFFQPG